MRSRSEWSTLQHDSECIHGWRFSSTSPGLRVLVFARSGFREFLPVGSQRVAQTLRLPSMVANTEGIASSHRDARLKHSTLFRWDDLLGLVFFSRAWDELQLGAQSVSSPECPNRVQFIVAAFGRVRITQHSICTVADLFLDLHVRFQALLQLSEHEFQRANTSCLHNESRSHLPGVACTMNLVVIC